MFKQEDFKMLLRESIIIYLNSISLKQVDHFTNNLY